LDTNTIIAVFLVLFAVFVFLGFYGSRWRKGNLGQMHEWSLAGRRLGTWLAFFLVGADLYTAYTFVAIPSAVHGSGALFFYAVPYVLSTFGIALIFGPKLWRITKDRGYITGSDYVKGRFNSSGLGILTAIVGIVSLLPYIALQIVGMQAVLAVMLQSTNLGTNVEDVSLVLAFLVLAAFTFTSGLRGAALTAVFKDILIWVTVIAIIVAVYVSVSDIGSKFSALKALPTGTLTLKSTDTWNYLTYAIGSAFALYLYPHAVNGILSAQDERRLRLSTSLLPLYGVGLALLALLGLFVYFVPAASAIVTSKTIGGGTNYLGGLLTVPALAVTTLPAWLAGVALLGIFIGGLVPAAIMAISQANLLTRNIVKEFKPDLSESAEVNTAKWASAIFKFIALGFVFLLGNNYTYAVQLQLLGGVLVIQLLPSLFLSLYTNFFSKWALIVGLIAGIFTGLILEYYESASTGALQTFYNTPIGGVFVAVIAVIINLVLVFVVSLGTKGSRPIGSI
jgi:SSS family solute:Na+ symporter